MPTTLLPKVVGFTYTHFHTLTVGRELREYSPDPKICQTALLWDKLTWQLPKEVDCAHTALKCMCAREYACTWHLCRYHASLWAHCCPFFVHTGSMAHQQMS